MLKGPIEKQKILKQLRGQKGSQHRLILWLESKLKKKKELRSLMQKANYIDRAPAACQ
jgi:hypothetical protein